MPRVQLEYGIFKNTCAKPRKLPNFATLPLCKILQPKLCL